MFNILKLSTWTISGLFLVPLLFVFSSIFTVQFDVWQHLASTVLSDYVRNSLILALSTGLGTIFLGTYLAWIMVHYQFVGKTLLQWLLLLPLAMPAYIIAYTYTGLFDFAGPFQALIRSTFVIAPNEHVLPDIRNLAGASIMMILVLYPYVYLLARTAFQEQSSQYALVSQLSGVSKWSHFTKIALPLARPAIITGAALAMMESLADYGTVAYFGVSTFTTGIYRTWFGMGNLQAASQLASMLCVFVFILLVLEKHSRKHASRFQSRQGSNVRAKARTGKVGAGLFVLCLLPPLFGFIIPFAQLLFWAVVYFEQALLNDYLPLLRTSLTLAFISTLVIVLCALVISYSKRIFNSKRLAFLSQFVSLGYALPGVVIAVGVVQTAGLIDNSINEILLALIDYQPGLIISGGMGILIFAYCVRYLSVALHNTETGLERIKPNLDEVSATLGASQIKTLRKIHIPLLNTSLISASILVFVDILKELPASLILRPFNVNTLAVKTFELASDERLIDAALPAISIVFAGLLPIVVLTMNLEKPKK
ncbi:ABC transporter permease [Glaciecola sp. 2405UD65-10]|uniref:ABC transporter permease n=1 Tax=Glaciecola sp. 2405UD65-10 TaxID=3397244 RepID=UPI003B58E100